MRIALLTAEYPPDPGGVGDYTRELGQALLARGLSVEVLTGPHPAAPPLPPYTVLDLARWDWSCWSAVGTALERLRPDVLHIQYQTGAYAMHPAVNLLPWWLRRRAASPRLAVTAHDLLEPYLWPKAGPARRWVTRRLLADVHAAVVTNADDIALARSRLGVRAALIPIGSNIAVAPPPGYSPQAWRARLGVGPDQTLLAYFGMISRSKGLETLLEALERLPPSVSLLLVGGPSPAPHDQEYAAAIQRRIVARGLEARVCVTGHCPAPDVSGHLLAADAAVLPFADGASFRRGSLLAALAHGAPVVTTHPPGRTADPPSGLQTDVPELRDGANVLLVQPGDPTGLAAAVGRLLAEPPLRARLRAAGAELARLFSWENIAARHQQLYAALS
jgi:glycosyltransferase involved in cell wall biosynthesis